MRYYYWVAIIVELSILPLLLMVRHDKYIFLWILVCFLFIVAVKVKIQIDFKKFLKMKDWKSYKELEDSFMKGEKIIQIINKGGYKKYYDCLFNEEIKASEQYKKFCESPRFQFVNFVIVGVMMFCALWLGTYLGFLT